MSGWIWEGGTRRRKALGDWGLSNAVASTTGSGSAVASDDSSRYESEIPSPIFLADVAMVVLPAISLVSATEHLLREVTSGLAVLFLQ